MNFKHMKRNVASKPPSFDPYSPLEMNFLSWTPAPSVLTKDTVDVR